MVKDDFIFTRIFGKEHTHHELVIRSEHVIRLLMFTGKMKNEYREAIWKMSEENDGEMSDEVFQSIKGASREMKPEDRLFFIDKIKEIKDDELMPRHI